MVIIDIVLVKCKEKIREGDPSLNHGKFMKRADARDNKIKLRGLGAPER